MTEGKIPTLQTWCMNNRYQDNSYFALAQIVSPWSSTDNLASIHELIVRNKTQLDFLIVLANHHLCSPQLYLSLKRLGWLDDIAEEIREYLETILFLNRERNIEILKGLQMVLTALQRHGVKAILLKGGASFVDTLYDDLGARLMHDIDILIEKNNTETTRNCLLELGYLESDMPGMEKENLPTDDRHCHLPAFYKPETPLTVEVHYDVAYGQAGRIFNLPAIWRNKIEGTVSGRPVYIFDHTNRVLHNAVHALIPECEYISSSIQLRQIFEFALIAQKYKKFINWKACLTSCHDVGVADQFLAYAQTACQLFNMEMPKDLPRPKLAAINACRLITGGNYFPLPAQSQLRHTRNVKKKIINMLLKVYYLINLPFWIWNNVCYAEGLKQLPMRARYLIRKMLSPESRARIRL